MLEHNVVLLPRMTLHQNTLDVVNLIKAVVLLPRMTLHQNPLIA